MQDRSGDQGKKGRRIAYFIRKLQGLDESNHALFAEIKLEKFQISNSKFQINSKSQTLNPKHSPDFDGLNPLGCF